jgi:phospholipase C
LAVVLFGAELVVASSEGINIAELREKIARKTNLTPIEHVVVLMLENRSFDHMLGFLKKQNPEINGCLPNEEGCSNPDDPLSENPTFYTVDDTAVYSQASPSHSIHGTTQQIYGADDDSRPPSMQGFIKSYEGPAGAGNGASVMKCFSPEHVPVIANLTMEYTVFDSWFPSVPGPTMPNRAYAAAATSHGMGTSDVEMIVKGLPSKTMFRQLQEMGLDYRIYFELVPALLMFKDLRHKDARPKYHGFKKFYEDVAAGDLPELSWLEPAYYTVGNNTHGHQIVADDQHPDHDVSLGDKLIKDVYESLRASPVWNKTAFIITYDEHGGFFDHVSPHPDPVPSPDGINCTEDPFDFTRIGVRVPTIVISPWVKKGAVIHAPVIESEVNMNILPFLPPSFINSFNLLLLRIQSLPISPREMNGQRRLNQFSLLFVNQELIVHSRHRLLLMRFMLPRSPSKMVPCFCRSFNKSFS